MNICFAGCFTAGGTERVTLELANELSLDSEFNIVLVNTSKRQLFFDASNNIKYICLCQKCIFDRIVEFRKILKIYKIDILVSIEALMGIYSIPATIGSSIRNVVWEHANYYQTQGSRWTRMIRKMWLIYADKYVVLTKRDLNNFISHEIIKCSIKQIYNPLSLLKKTNVDCDSKEHIILSCGHLLPIKQFDLIPRIFYPIMQKHNDWQWHIYGDGSAEAIKRIQNEIDKYGLNNHIILKGRSKNIVEAYKTASIYALTSKQEGLPTVLLEAMSYRIPCISFDIETGPDEIIEDNINGFLVEKYNVDEFSRKLLLLIENEETRICFSENIVDTLVKFNFDKNMAEWHQLLLSFK